LKRGECERLLPLCADRGLALLSDEVFSEYALVDDPTRVATAGDNGACLTFVLGGLSKSAGLPQMKAAWVIASGPGADDAMRRLEWIADTYLSVSAPVLYALPDLLRLAAPVREQIRARTQENLDRLARCGLGALRVEGGWYAIIPTPARASDEDWAIHLLERDGLLTQPGYFYDLQQDSLVLSLLTGPGGFQAGIDLISRRFDDAAP
jgi:hypothetical protein